MRPPCLAGAGFALHPVVGGGREHSVFAGDPAAGNLPVFHPRRDLRINADRADHPGAAVPDQHRSERMRQIVGSDHDFAKFIRSASVDTSHKKPPPAQEMLNSETGGCAPHQKESPGQITRGLSKNRVELLGSPPDSVGTFDNARGPARRQQIFDCSLTVPYFLKKSRSNPSSLRKFFRSTTGRSVLFPTGIRRSGSLRAVWNWWSPESRGDRRSRSWLPVRR